MENNNMSELYRIFQENVALLNKNIEAINKNIKMIESQIEKIQYRVTLLENFRNTADND